MTAGAGRWLVVAAFVAVAVLFVIYGMFDPCLPLFPKCPFKLLTGFDCPGCGSQRAIHALLNGHIAEAWRYNAMLLVMIPVITLLFVAQLMRNKHPKLYNTLNSRMAIMATLVVVVGWWIFRNIFGV